jgi:hypothetical protein
LTSPPRQKIPSSSSSSSSTSILRTQPYQQQRHYSPEETARQFAATAPQAGYLRKLGKHVRTFKKRYFVLQPASHLYYFTHPDDTEPRGCINLEQAQIIDISPVAFAVQLGRTKDVVELQANTPAEASAWKQVLASERYIVMKETIRKLELKKDAYQSRNKELEEKMKEFRMIEHDRDDAIQDANRWKHKHDSLQEAIRRLTLQLRRKSSSSTDNQQDDNTDIIDEKEMDEDDIAIDIQKVPGTHFSALYNAVNQIQENLQIASREAELAVDDVRTANEQRTAAQTRMAEIEQQLCKLWEENCALRKAMKQKKREKRVLIREVKNLRQQQQQEGSNHYWNHKSPRKQPHPQGESKETHVVEMNPMMQPHDSDDEDRLITELEEHVESSLKLHQEFLKANSEIQEQLGGRFPSVDRSIQTLNDTLQSLLMDSASSPPPPNEPSSAEQPRLLKHPSIVKNNHPLQMASLFNGNDDDDDEDDDDDDESDRPLEPLELAAARPSSCVSSVMAEASGTESDALDHDDDEHFHHDAVNYENENNDDDDDDDDDLSSMDEERPNPLSQIDAEKEEDPNSLPPRLCATSSLSESSASRTTILRDNKATSKLSCPLADVVNTNHHREDHVDPKLVEDVDSDNQIYHLTFYSRRIGLQFQKVPPPPRKANGLLTEAMTADLMGVSDAADKTAAELRRIASISNEKMDNPERMTLEVATPVDAVLVCGFEGFDDSGTNIRPKLGARLVAFDGISVEVGNWTFDAVRKSIQARPRPLTLSFRNDFLTTEQRRILTKAIQDVKERSVPRPVERTKSSRSICTEPSTQSSKSGEPGVQPTRENQSAQSHDDDLSVSVASSDYYRRPLPQSFSGGRSVSSGNFRSFSEAGSSVSVLSAVGPLVSNLLQHGRLREPFTPEYLRRAPEYVEATPQHQDFKAGLL